MIDICPWPSTFFVPPPKVSEYLLNLDHADGGPKARYLISYGFDPIRPLELAAALRGHAKIDRFVGIKVAPGGLKYVFNGALPAPNGRDATILSVWQLDVSSKGPARFITAFPGQG